METMILICRVLGGIGASLIGAFLVGVGCYALLRTAARTLARFRDMNLENRASEREVYAVVSFFGHGVGTLFCAGLLLLLILLNDAPFVTYSRLQAFRSDYSNGFGILLWLIFFATMALTFCIGAVKGWEIFNPGRKALLRRGRRR